MGCHFLLQGIFPIQGSNPRLLLLLHWQVDSLPLSHLGSLFSIVTTPIYVPFNSGSEVKISAYKAGDLGSIPGSGRSPGEGNGNPLQYSSCRIPWMEEPGRLQSTGSQRVRHDWATSLHFTLLQQCMRVPFSPHPCQHSFFLALFGKVILTDVRWYLIGAFICITLIIVLLNIFSRACLLAICMSSIPLLCPSFN